MTKKKFSKRVVSKIPMIKWVDVLQQVYKELKTPLYPSMTNEEIEEIQEANDELEEILSCADIQELCDVLDGLGFNRPYEQFDFIMECIVKF